MLRIPVVVAARWRPTGFVGGGNNAIGKLCSGTFTVNAEVLEQTATFHKPAHAQRSSFRIEPLNGAS